MSRLVATLTFGREPALGGGVEPVAFAHCYEAPVPRFLGYLVRESGDLDRVPGAYAPDLDADPAYPVTDLLLALAPELSSIAGRIRTLDTKAEANYGVGFREKAFDSDVAWGSDGYGRHFEARSQVESHPIDGAVAYTSLGAGEAVRAAVADNLVRLDCTVVRGD
ncbi:hypothetical protein [Halosegnis marinus]|uniref:Uncharacterized protein n=1 Tax=Halosegnis marinus TaxID=3034023 RepID=A0ABD5ZSB7_9EURY|nr:hypothetical protein [Halosegnis sp. DT85]